MYSYSEALSNIFSDILGIIRLHIFSLPLLRALHTAHSHREFISLEIRGALHRSLLAIFKSPGPPVEPQLLFAPYFPHHNSSDGSDRVYNAGCKCHTYAFVQILRRSLSFRTKCIDIECV